MKALQHVGHGEPRQAIHLIDLPDPDPGPDDIVMAMLAVPVHGVDLLNITDPGRWVIHNAANSSCGRWLIALIKQAGLHSINIVRREETFESLTAIGADACVVDTGEDDFDAIAARVDGVTGGADLHLGFDTIAGDASYRMAHCLSRDAKLIVYGDLSCQPSAFWFRDLSRKGIHVHGYRKSDHEKALTQGQKRDIYARLCTLVAEQKVRLAIAATYGFDDYGTAFEHAAKNGAERDGKVLLLPNL